MRDTDLKFWFGLGLSLVGLAARYFGVPEPLAYLLLFGGSAMMLVSAFTWLLRRMPGWPATPATMPVAERPSVDPITYVELAQIAVRDLGWDFSNRWQTLDLRDCIQHGCNAGAITVTAIPKANEVPESYRNQYLPIPIPQADWHGKLLRIWIEDDATTTLDRSDNWIVRIGGIGRQSSEDNYRDPRLTDRRDAIAWLRAHGARFMGSSEAAHDATEARRRRRERGEA